MPFDPAALNRRPVPPPAAEVKRRPDGRPLPTPPKFLFDLKPKHSLDSPMVRGPKAPKP